jgi:hypothetical protein
MEMKIKATRCATQKRANAKIANSELMDFFARNVNRDFSAMPENTHANVSTFEFRILYLKLNSVLKEI